MLYIMQLEFCKLSKPSKSWQIVNTASIIIMMDRTGYKFVKNGFVNKEYILVKEAPFLNVLFPYRHCPEGGGV